MNKSALRKELLTRRSALSPVEQSQAADAICNHLKDRQELRNISRMALYKPIHGEIDTEPIRVWCRELGIETVYPRVIVQEGFPAIEFAAVDQKADFSPGFRGIPEPSSKQVVAPDEIEVFLVPGIAFDRKGTRLGYGGGSYDAMLLNRSDSSIVVGLAYAFQVLETVPCDPHDIAVDALVTEEAYCELSLLDY